MTDKGLHFYRDTKVSLERLDAFADDSRGSQVAVMAQLRMEAADDSFGTELGIVGVGIAVIVTVLVPSGGLHLGSFVGPTAWISTLTASLTLGLLVAAALIPLVVRAVISSRKREHATVWVNAYEDELERRRAQVGRAARAWQRSH